MVVVARFRFLLLRWDGRVEPPPSPFSVPGDGGRFDLSARGVGWPWTLVAVRPPEFSHCDVWGVAVDSDTVMASAAADYSCSLVDDPAAIYYRSQSSSDCRANF